MELKEGSDNIGRHRLIVTRVCASSILYLYRCHFKLCLEMDLRVIICDFLIMQSAENMHYYACMSHISEAMIGALFFIPVTFVLDHFYARAISLARLSSTFSTSFF